MIRRRFAIAALGALAFLAGTARAQFDPLNPGGPAPAPRAPAATPGVPVPSIPLAPPGSVPARTVTPTGEPLTILNFIGGMGYSRQVFPKDGLWETRYRTRHVTETKYVGHICVDHALQQRLDFVRARFIRFVKSKCSEKTTMTATGFTTLFSCPASDSRPHVYPRTRVVAVIEPERVVLDQAEDDVNIKGQVLMYAGENQGYIPADERVTEYWTGYEHRYVGPTCPAGMLPGQGKDPDHRGGFDLNKGKAQWAR